MQPTVYSGHCLTCDEHVVVADLPTTDVMRVPKADGKPLEVFTICGCGQFVPLPERGSES